MGRVLVFIALLALPILAAAEIPRVPLFPPECWPRPIGDGAAPALRIVQEDAQAQPGSAWAGVCVTWWCPSYEARDGWRRYGICGRPDELRPVEWALSLTSDQARAEFEAHAWRETTTAEWDTMIAAWEETRPQPRYFVVRDAGEGNTAPTYRRLTTGARASKPNGAAVVGSACDCRERLRYNQLWCNTGDAKILENESGGAFARCVETAVPPPQISPPGPEPYPLPPEPCGPNSAQPCAVDENVRTVAPPVVTHCGPGARAPCQQ